LAGKGQVTCHCCSGECKKAGHFQNRNRLVQRYTCTRCGKWFSEAQPLDGLRIDHAKVVQIVKLLCEGLGVRACSRLTDCHTHTVLSVLETVGQKCESFLDQKLRNLTVGSLQIDEIWSRVGITQRFTTKDDQLRGDFYTFLGIDARTKLIAGHFTGKRDAVSTDFFVDDIAKRIVGRVQVTSDGFNPYPDTLRRYLLDRLDYAIMQKNYGPDFNNPRDPNRRYAPAICTGYIIKIKAGNPRRDRISTSFVERANLSVRHFNRRFTRLTLGWSRKLENHKHAIALFVAAYNFCKVHSTLGCTPAVGAKLTDHTWTVEELIEQATKE